MKGVLNKWVTRTMVLGCIAGLLTALAAGPALADIAAAKKWIDSEFQPSTLTKDQQLKEMEWFIQAAKPFQGMNIKVVSETIPTHEYEAKVLAKAFEEITGIKVSFDLIQEGDVIEKLQTQWASGENIYDAWINDSDLIGTHARYGYVVPLSDFMAGEGKEVTLPTLDVDDFMGKSFTTGMDGKLYQLPDQQFANLYWFRYDWFNRPDIKQKFKEIYGYELGVPVNWSAYEDIAEFFTEKVREIDGKAVFGHNDYGKKAPDLGWRFTDAWLSMAGAGDKGIPNGKPVDEWGIRMEAAGRWGPPWPAAATPTDRPPSTPCANTWSGCASTPLRALWAWTSTPTCRSWPTATWPSRFSGTRPSFPAWSLPGRRSTPTAPPNGAWPPRPTAAIGKRA
jgi:glycerol transport system substrate-binding protein